MRYVRFVTLLLLVLLPLAPGRSAAEDCHWEWRQECALQGEPPRMVCYWVPVRVCQEGAARLADRLERFARLFGAERRLTVVVEVASPVPAADTARRILAAAGHGDEAVAPAPAGATGRAAIRLDLPLAGAAGVIAELREVPGVTKITPVE